MPIQTGGGGDIFIGKQAPTTLANCVRICLDSEWNETETVESPLGDCEIRGPTIVECKKYDTSQEDINLQLKANNKKLWSCAINFMALHILCCAKPTYNTMPMRETTRIFNSWRMIIKSN